MQKLEQSFLKEILTYDHTTGVFYWKKLPPKAYRTKVGDPAGRTIQNKYVQIGIAGRYYLAHRLAFLYMTGRWPDKQIDHLDGNTQNNAWSNLREASPQENSRNCSLSKANTSGVQGVYWNKKLNKWVSKIGSNGKQIHLGVFTYFEDACEARKSAETDLNYHANHGRLK